MILSYILCLVLTAEGFDPALVLIRALGIFVAATFRTYSEPHRTNVKSSQFRHGWLKERKALCK